MLRTPKSTVALTRPGTARDRHGPYRGHWRKTYHGHDTRAGSLFELRHASGGGRGRRAGWAVIQWNFALAVLSRVAPCRGSGGCPTLTVE